MGAQRTIRQRGSRQAAQRDRNGAENQPRPRPLAIWLSLVLMWIGVVAVYVPIPSSPGDNTLLGLDFFQIHLHRIRFAQEHLFAPHPTLPAWYPRELLGTPFWSNIQDFPLIPTRLILLGLDPLLIYPTAVILAAILSATFTFLFARKLGLGPPAAAVAGWTFACAGFFTSRVMAGHLPLLEAYPALPLLLWLIELSRTGMAERRESRPLLFLGLACCCISFAGHPQIPMYSMIVAAAYAIVRLPNRQGVRIVAVMLAGAGVAAIVLYPMWLLIGRSTRVLALDPAANDIAFPYARLIAFFLPWKQGWPGSVSITPPTPVSFGDDANFWETVCYVGWLPLIASAFMLVRAIVQRKMPARPWLFITAVAIGGLLLALPLARAPFAHLPGTFLRSPARLLYPTAFALSLATGAAAHVFICHAVSRRKWMILAPVAIVVFLHLFDLGTHDRHFVRMVAVRLGPTDADMNVAQQVGDGRVAIDSSLPTPLNREIDDVGYFDSIALARPYELLLDLGGQSPRLNTQYIDGFDIGPRGLAACGVKFVATAKLQPGMLSSNGQIRAFGLKNVAPRVAFFQAEQTLRLDVEETHQKLRDQRFDLNRALILPLNAIRDTSSPANDAQPADVSYQRPEPDSITCQVGNRSPGYLRILEADDAGWHASVDGSPAEILPADWAFMAIPLAPGSHVVQLNFSTPGKTVGQIISALSLLVLLSLAFGPSLLQGKNPAKDQN